MARAGAVEREFAAAEQPFAGGLSAALSPRSRDDAAGRVVVLRPPLRTTSPSDDKASPPRG